MKKRSETNRKATKTDRVGPDSVMEDRQSNGKGHMEVLIGSPPPAVELSTAASNRISLKSSTTDSKHDILRHGSSLDIMFTRSKSKTDSEDAIAFDLQQMEDAFIGTYITKRKFRKYTTWLGVRFKDWQMEFKFLNEHSMLNKRTVYAGYIFQFINTVISNLVHIFTISGHGDNIICAELDPTVKEICLNVLLPGGVSKSKQLATASMCFSAGLILSGALLNWYIHESKRITNKAWAMLAVWMNYFLNIVGCTLIFYFLNTNDILWAPRIYITFMSNFLLAVWFTGLTLMQTILMSILTTAILYGITIPRALHDKYMTSQDIAKEELDTYLLGYVIFSYFLATPIVFSIMALTSAFLNERTARMRFLQRLIITHQQNNVIKEKSYNEKMQRTFLENMLPPSIVDKLQGDAFSMGSVERLSQKHQGVSILFADIAGFTSFATQVDSATVMSFLNELFLHFDDLCDPHNVYKVETVGDCYVAAVGVVTGQIMTGEEMDEDEVQSRELSDVHSLPSYANTKDMLSFAKAMVCASRVVIKPGLESPALMRVGMHTGPCMSGIVGTKNLRYCLFGDSMNTAARMEQTGVVDAIHVSEVVADLVPDESWESRGSVTVKGKGAMETYLLRIVDV